MPFPTLFHNANSLWLFFALYFTVRYRSVQAKRSNPVAILSWERLCLLVSVPLLFFPLTHISILRIQLHHSYALAVTGFVLVVLGLAFAAWARDLLGRNWSSQVIVQDGHQLVTAGPYAYVRHPLYTGILTAVAGTALIVDDLAALLALGLAAVSFSLKAHREEELLQTEFGAVYSDYRAHTGALLPRLSRVQSMPSAATK